MSLDRSKMWDSYRIFMCYSCNRKTQHNIEHGYIDGIGIVHIWKCDSCGKKIPEGSLKGYLKTGDVVVPQPRGRSRR